MAKKAAKKDTGTGRTTRKATAESAASRKKSAQAASGKSASRKKAAKAKAKKASTRKAAKSAANKGDSKSNTPTRSTTKKKAASASKSSSKTSVTKGAKKSTASDRPTKARKAKQAATAAEGTNKTPKTSKTQSTDKRNSAASILMHPGVRIATFSKESGGNKGGAQDKTNRSATGKTGGRRTNASTPATAYDPIQFEEERPRLPRTRLGDARLAEFKDLLLQKRRELMGDVERLTNEALHRRTDGSGDNSTMPIHMADLGSDNWEQDFTLGLLASEQSLVREIDQALQRIADRTYGVCLATHRPIGLARLRAKPWARYCIEYARAREEGRSI